MADFFLHDPQLLSSIDFEHFLSPMQDMDCTSQSEELNKFSKRFKEDGLDVEADAFRLLAVATNFFPNFGDRLMPYRPMAIMDGRRTPLPSDLSELELIAIRKITDLIKEPTLKARLFDILWIQQKSHLDAKAAAENYLASARKLDAEKTWVSSSEAYLRALQLSSMLGRSKPLFENASSSLINAIKKNADDDSYRPQHFMQVHLQFLTGKDQEIADQAEAIAVRSEAGLDWRKARAFWEIAEIIYNKEKNKEEAKRCAMKGGWTYVRESEPNAGGDQYSYMIAADSLAKGIECLRRVGADKKDIDSLKGKLTDYQSKINDEMSTMELKHDISSYSEAAEKHVQGHDFQTALLRFAFGTQLTKPEEVRNRVKMNAEKYPMIHLFGASIMDDAGRVVMRRKGLLNVSNEEYEEEMENEMFNSASSFDWNLRVQGFIEPARYMLLQEHFPKINDFTFLVSNNPVVPPGHEMIFLKGIHAGMHGDFILASHLLVPQLENLIRHVMERHGVDIRNIESDGTQPVKVLGALLGMSEARTVFGERLLFELRGALIEKAGFNFRNQLAHGFIDANDCNSIPAVMLWWLTIRLCILPVFLARNDGSAAGLKSHLLKNI